VKILHVYNRHRGRGGADNATESTIRLLAERGFEVRTVVRDSLDLPTNMSGRIRAFLSGFHAPGAVKEVAAAIREFRPDIVHAHEIFPLISPAIFRECARQGVPAVLSCYDYRFTCPVYTHVSHGEICTRCIGGHEYRAVLHNCRDSFTESLAFALHIGAAKRFGRFKHVARYVTCSDFQGTWMVANAGIPLERVTTLPCVIDMPATTVDASQGTYVAYAGRFAPEKGVALLIRACQRAGLPLKLAGDAPTHPAAEGLENVSFVMTKSRADLAEFYRGARFLVVPSTWFETFGIVAGEAMSHGVPVIASRIGALEELVTDDVAGYLFPVGDEEALSKVMRRLWDDPEACRRLGTGARKRIMEHSHEDVFVERLRDIYAGVLRSMPAAR
jgi:glycosyltransferase involved in cell wall biosynthesis